MARVILHKDGRFNVYDTVLCRPLFSQGMDEREMLDELMRPQQLLGDLGKRPLQKLERAKKYGSSEVPGIVGTGLEHHLNTHLVAQQGVRLTEAEFIKTFLS